MAKAKKKKSTSRKRSPVRKKTAALRVRRAVKKSRSLSSPLARARKVLLQNAKEQLREALYKREIAKTAKAHKAAVNAIASARLAIKKYSTI